VDVSYEFENAENAGLDFSEDFGEDNAEVDVQNAGVDFSEDFGEENAGVDVPDDFGENLENVDNENTGVEVSKNEIDNGVDVSKKELVNGSDNAEVDENLVYAKSLDDTESDPENLDANLDAGENPDSLEG